MKKIAFALTMVLAGAAMAEANYWAAAHTVAYWGDSEPGNAKTGNYSAYYCTVAAAQEMFNVSSVDGLTSYLEVNFNEARDTLAATGYKNDMSTKTYEGGQYNFLVNLNTPVNVGSEYVAMIFWESGRNRAFRVMASDDEMLASGKAFFDDAPGLSSGQNGAWTPFGVPEPTSGLLILVGIGGLALRRRRQSDVATVSRS